MARQPTWKDRAEYVAARAVEAGLSALPRAAAERVGLGLGTVLRRPLGVRRRTVEANLRRAFPDAPQAWIEETIRGTYRHLGREAVAILRLSHLDREAILERTTPIQGWDGLVAALGEGRGAILATGHVGNWEIAAAAVAARGYPIDAVVKRLHNPLVDAWLDEARGRLGIGTIDMRRAPSGVPRALAAGHAVGIVSDQDAGRSGLWIPFFGHAASTHRGPALFALRLGAPLFACSAIRLPSGGYDLRVERVPVERSGDLQADVERLTATLSSRLERVVRRAPEQYFWFHKRWKTPPPAELAGGGPGTNHAAGDAGSRP